MFFTTVLVSIVLINRMPLAEKTWYKLGLSTRCIKLVGMNIENLKTQKLEKARNENAKNYRKLLKKIMCLKCIQNTNFTTLC